MRGTGKVLSRRTRRAPRWRVRHTQEIIPVGPQICSPVRSGPSARSRAARLCSCSSVALPVRHPGTVRASGSFLEVRDGRGGTPAANRREPPNTWPLIRQSRRKKPDPAAAWSICAIDHATLLVALFPVPLPTVCPSRRSELVTRTSMVDPSNTDPKFAPHEHQRGRLLHLHNPAVDKTASHRRASSDC
jgi:hypothetical protein